MRRGSPSPDFSKFLTSEGFANLQLNYYDRQSSTKPQTTKVSLNKTLPSPSVQSQPRSQPNQANLTARKKATIKPINTRSGVAKLSLFVLRPGFIQLKSNFKQLRRTQGAERVYDLLARGRTNRLQGGYNELLKNMKKIRRLRAFSARFVKLYSRYESTRYRIALSRLSIYNNILLSRLVKNDQKSKISTFEGVFKRLTTSRLKKTLSHLQSFSKLFKAQQKQLKKLPLLFRNVTYRNLLGAYHKLSVHKKTVRLPPSKPSRSLTRNMKTEQSVTEAPKPQIKQPLEQKYRQLEGELRMVRQQLNQKQQLLKRSQVERVQLQRDSKEMKQRVKTYESQNKLLKSRVESLSQQHQNLGLSRNTRRSMEQEEIDFQDDKSEHSATSKKSGISNFSSRSFVQNASALSFNTMLMLRKLTGKTNPLKQCCESKKYYSQLQSKYNEMKTKYELLQAEHELIIQINKHLELSIEGNLMSSTSDEQVQKLKKENVELKAGLEGYKTQVKKLKQDKERIKKEFKKKLQDIYCKVTKKRSQSSEG